MGFCSGYLLNSRQNSAQSLKSSQKEYFFSSLKEWEDYYGITFDKPEDWYFDAEIARFQQNSRPENINISYSLRKGKYLTEKSGGILNKRIYLDVVTDDKPQVSLKELYKSELVEGKKQNENELKINGYEAFKHSRLYGGVFTNDPDYYRHTVYIRLKNIILTLRYQDEIIDKESMHDFEKVYNSVKS